MFNRFKNFNLDSFLDTKIAEEQARQRQGQPSAPRRQPSGAKRTNGRTDSPSKRGQARGEGDRGPPTKGPDPSEFIIDDDEASSRAPTPKPPEPAEEANETKIGNLDADGDAEKKTEVKADIVGGEDEHESAKAPTGGELPQEVQLKLRRLQKLESKYGELLRSYRVAHARVSTIEPFEASLRENTPLASINDPAALVEYLAQVNLKGDMIMSELKKVTEDRNSIQGKLDSALKEVNGLRNSSDNMKTSKTISTDSKGKDDDEFFSYESEVPRLQDELEEKVQKIDNLISENETLRKDLQDLRDSHQKVVNDLEAAKSSPSNGEPEVETDPADRSVLSDRLEEHEKSLIEVENVTAEAESALDLVGSSQSLPDRIRRIAQETKAARQARTEIGEQHDKLQETLKKAEKELFDLHEKYKSFEEASKEAQNGPKKQLEEMTNKFETLERQLQQSREEFGALEQGSQEAQAASTKKLGNLDNLVKTLRDQLHEAEKGKKGAEDDLQSMQVKLAILEKEHSLAKSQSMKPDTKMLEQARNEVSRLERELDGAYELLATTGIAAELNEIIPPETPGPVNATITPTTATSDATSKPDSAAAKKKNKNKKKKKGQAAGPVADENVAEPEPKPVEAEKPNEADTIRKASIPSLSKLTPDQLTKLRERIGKSGSHASCEASIKELKDRLQEKSAEMEKLNTEIVDKTSAIDRLSSRLKGEDDLREEIEGLKDDLMHIGNEHVGVKDQVKQLRTQKENEAKEHAEALKEVEAKLITAREQRTELEKTANGHAEERTKLEAELETLRTSSGSSGKELEEKLAKANAEKSALEQRVSLIEGQKSEAEKSTTELETQLSELKSKSTSLQTDLNAANELAQSRYKDLTSLRDRMSKIQPEINNLKSESERLKASNEELKKDNEKLGQLESKSDSLTSEINMVKATLQSREAEVKTLTEKLRKAESQLSDLEEKERQANKSAIKSESSLKEATEGREKATKELSRVKDELEATKKKLSDLESQTSALRQEAASAKEELQLKAAQQASAQSLMDSMQDQTRELATQMKEVRARCDSLEEELADSQRLLMERSREGETMRRLLADVEGRAEARVKEMRERMDLAVEERDRAEEDASSVTRRRAREVDELRVKVKDAERARAEALEEKEEFEKKMRGIEGAKDGLERKMAEAQRELEEVRGAMTQLRDALDEGERQTRDLERERGELRKTVEDKEKRLEKLQKGSKTMQDELKSLQAAKARQMSATPSQRSSIDSSRMTSPAQNGSTGGGKAGDMDYVYLKNVLLQFLEQKDKKHQMQLVPVLGMLLHFDRKDEQKWMTAINAKV